VCLCRALGIFLNWGIDTFTNVKNRSTSDQENDAVLGYRIYIDLLMLRVKVQLQLSSINLSQHTFKRSVLHEISLV